MTRDMLLPAVPRRRRRVTGGEPLADGPRAAIHPNIDRASPLIVAAAPQVRHALAAATLLAAWPAHAQGASDPANAPLAAAVALLSLGIAAGALVWAWRAQRRARDVTRALQHTRAEAHALRQVLDQWQWRTDAQHRLTEWRPPAQVAGTEPVVRLGEPLWSVFQAPAGQEARLQPCLERQVPLSGVRVTLGAEGDPVGPAFVLQGQPVLDATGRFAGHVGTARLAQDGVTQWFTEVLQALPHPVVRLTRPVRNQPPRLLRLNSAGEAWLGDRGLPDGAPTWDQLLAGMPAELRPALEAAVAHLPDVPVALPGGWSLRLHRLPCTPHERGDEEVLAVFQRPESPPGQGDALAHDAESFSYTVSHDLRAPIRVVEGFTKIVKEDYAHALDRIGHDHLDRVLAAAARMNSMIDSLLALSQLSARPLSRQPVNLSLLAGYIIDDLRRQAPHRQVEVVIEPGLQVHGDPTLLRVVLENLLGNAWKYTGKRPVARIWFEGSEHDGRPTVTVRDNGAGFDMRFADRLFGVFQRLHSANDFQGTGVGLASVRRILRRHGGDIWAEAEVERGARFHIRL